MTDQQERPSLKCPFCGARKFDDERDIFVGRREVTGAIEKIGASSEVAEALEKLNAFREVFEAPEKLGATKEAA